MAPFYRPTMSRGKRIKVSGSTVDCIRSLTPESLLECGIRSSVVTIDEPIFGRRKRDLTNDMNEWMDPNEIAIEPMRSDTRVSLAQFSRQCRYLLTQLIDRKRSTTRDRGRVAVAGNGDWAGHGRQLRPECPVCRCSNQLQYSDDDGQLRQKLKRNADAPFIERIIESALTLI